MGAQKSLDIAFCLDRNHFVGVLPVLRSLLAHTELPQDAFAFYFVVGAGESQELRASLRAGFPRAGFRCEIAEFRPTPFLDDYIRAGLDLTYAAYASSVMNFARFYLAEIYPELGKIAYLDADLIVQGEIAELFDEAMLRPHMLAAVRVASFGTWDGGFDLGSVLLDGFDPDAPVFNAGVYVTDLERWRRENVCDALLEWMRRHRRSMADSVFGTQSIMNLAFYGNVQVLPPEWNVRALGYHDDLAEPVLRAAKILHWAGPRKPWTEDGLYKSYWQPWATDPSPR